MRQKGRTLLGFLISAIFLYWALRGLDLRSFWQEVRSAQYAWLIPGVMAYFVGVWVRTWRWHYLLRPLKEVPIASLFPVVCIGYAGNNIYPARAGELLRAYILKQQADIPVSANLATVVVERLFDGLVMLAFVVFALPFTQFGSAYNNYVIGFSALFLGALILFLILAARPAWMQIVLDRVLLWWLPARFHEKVSTLAARFLDGLASLRNGRDVVMLFFTSVLIWLLETLKYWFVMHAFPFAVPFTVLMLMNGIVNLTTTLPGAPGHIGTFDAPGIKVLTSFGVPQSLATSYTLVLHVALWLPITLLGLYYLWRSHLDVKRVRQEAAAG